MKTRLSGLLLALAALTPLAAAQTTSRPTGLEKQTIERTPLELSIYAVTPTYAMTPRVVLIMGSQLDLVKRVTVGGKLVTILEQCHDKIIIWAPPGKHPGFWEVMVYTDSNHAKGMMELWPTLRFTPAGPSAAEEDCTKANPIRYPEFHPIVDIRLHNGAPGTFMLAGSFELRPHPLQLVVPPTGYEFFLANPLEFAAFGRFPDTGRIERRVAWPPAMHGTTVYVQAWCAQQLENGKRTYCFTNLETLSF